MEKLRFKKESMLAVRESESKLAISKGVMVLQPMLLMEKFSGVKTD